jgi:hypothetical protein
MPKLLDSEGVRVYIYADDHPPPHVHAYWAGEAVKIAIEDGKVIVGNLPRRKLDVATRFVSEDRFRLLEKWQSLNESR